MPKYHPFFVIGFSKLKQFNYNKKSGFSFPTLFILMSKYDHPIFIRLNLMTSLKARFLLKLVFIFVRCCCYILTVLFIFQFQFQLFFAVSCPFNFILNKLSILREIFFCLTSIVSDYLLSLFVFSSIYLFFTSHKLYCSNIYLFFLLFKVFKIEKIIYLVFS